LKLIAALLKHEILEISPNDLKELAQIYLTPLENLTKQDYQRFCDIIANAKVFPDARNALIRFIGDELCDRGMGDHFMLQIFKKLSKENIPWVACLSNHPISLIRCYEENRNKFTPTDLKKKFAYSIQALQACIDKGIISIEEVREWIEIYYLPHLKIADYTINPENRLTHYLHAPFDDELIAELAEQFDLTY